MECTTHKLSPTGALDPHHVRGLLHRAGIGYNYWWMTGQTTRAMIKLHITLLHNRSILIKVHKQLGIFVANEVSSGRMD